MTYIIKFSGVLITVGEMYVLAEYFDILAHNEVFWDQKTAAAIGS